MQFIKPTIVKQRSMQPNFYTNDYLFISKQSYKLFGGQPERGDVIVFKSKLEDAEGETKMLIKRVIGVPGDVINIHDGKVYINGKETDDNYTMDNYTTGNITELVVPADHLFCMGDNRAVSIDSRSDSVGLVSYKDIVGKVVFRVFPLRKFGTIHNPYKN
jgi:signal peptidase I